MKTFVDFTVGKFAKDKTLVHLKVHVEYEQVYEKNKDAKIYWVNNERCEYKG